MGVVEAVYASNPETQYLMRVLPIQTSFQLFGASEWAARLPSSMAFGTIVVLAGITANKTWGSHAGSWAAIATALNPLLWVYGGRAMPDVWLVLGLAVAVYGAANAHRNHAFYAAWAFGCLVALAAKPLGVLAPLSLVFLRHSESRKPLIVLGVVALSAFSVLTWNWDYATSRFGAGHPPFHAASRILVFGFVWGLMPLGYAALGNRDWRAWVIFTTFAAYALVDGWPFHEYYALPAAYAASLMAGPWLASHVRTARWASLAAPLGVLLALWASGDLGDDRLAISEEIPTGARAWAPADWQPALAWYNPSVQWADSMDAEYVIDWTASPGCQVVSQRSYAGQMIILSRCASEIPDEP